MDSCNSGSMHSSSCGDEEYDSRVDQSNTIFLSNNNPPPPPPPLVGTFTTTHPSSSSSLDPLTNYLDSMQKSPTHYPNQNPFLNLDMLWSKPDLGTFMHNHQPSSPSSSSHHNNNQAFLFSQLMTNHQSQTRGLSSVVVGDVSAIPTIHSTETPAPPSRGGVSDQSGNMGRNPKKRSRASRRAPTTVLTTDTTNFRAMVQEFTGIPAPPFTSSPFPRTRFDLFGSSSIRSHNLEHPPYLLRPFAQKLVQPQPPSSFPSMNNQFLGFQSASKYPDLGGSKTTQSPLEISPSTAVDSHRKMGVFEELGLTNSNIGGVLQHNNNMIHHQTSDIALSSLNNIMRNSSAEWAQRTTVVVADNDGGTLGGNTANYNQELVASTSNLMKGTECSSSSVPVATRGEVTVVESWINCSSD